MGLFGKIKNILFEDDDEVEEMPVYTKEEVNETPRRTADVEIEPTPVVEEPIKTSDNSFFRNVKRDIDLNYDEKDVLGEIPGAEEKLPEVNTEHVQVQPKKEEKKSIFPSFDEDEFERLNSRINRNESKARKDVQNRQNIGANQNVNGTNDARRANNNFSATSTSRDTRIENSERYKINNGGQPVKKTFTPSPIISPVYGILDKNYRKDDIVDKKGGMKREKIVKPVVKQEKTVTIEEAENNIVEVDIDSVRKKAYGELENLEKTLTKIEIPKMVEKEVPKVEESLNQKKTPMAVVEEEVMEKVVVSEAIKLKEETPSIEDQLEETFKVEDIETTEDTNLDKVVEDVIEQKIEKRVEKKQDTPVKSNPKMLDDLEKTSTLQILDDIEKELNSIKPISKDVNVIDDEDEIIEKDDTLEKDLFNLIDSMYEEGEEDEEDA